MENQNYTIGINLMCILLIIISSVAGITLPVVYLLSFGGFYKDYLLSSQSVNYNFYIMVTPVWILFYFLLFFSSILTLKRRAIGRIFVISVSAFGIFLTYFQYIIDIILSNDYGKTYLIGQSIFVDKYVLLWIIVIYLFTRPKIKEMF